MNRIYHGHELCADLVIGQLCFRVRVYNHSTHLFEPAFHEHIPASRISKESAHETLRALVARYAEWPGTFILGSHLNDRSKDPEHYPGFTHDVSYPEPGVQRITASAQEAHAWYDSVITKKHFRREA